MYNQQSERFLEHSRSPSAVQNGDKSLRADVTKDGYCIEYRESLFDHYWRLGKWMNQKPYPIKPLDYGVELALELYGLGKCSYWGYNYTEKPWFGDILGGMKWDAWTKYNGTPKTLC